MEPQQPTTHRTDPDDVEGHTTRIRFADAETDETDDTEGHGAKRPADAEREASDDVEGHGRRYYKADAERDETDDVEGHGVVGGYRPTHPKASDEEDDVAGHLSGALGSKKKTDDA